MPRTLLAGVTALLLLATIAGVAPAQNADGPVVTCARGTCTGTDANDTLVAGNESDTVIGRRGNDDIELDVVFAGGKPDVGRGGPGRDCIDGGRGADVMLGGPGDDNRPCEFTFFVNPRSALTGGPGQDTLRGGPGEDSLDGIFEADKLFGGRGADLVEDFASSDDDRLIGGRGDDTLDATDGGDDDVIDGGRGKDTCRGDAGDTYRGCEVSG